MQIKLSEFGPSMWFLGEPRRLIVSLNFMSPGPVEVDFASLSQPDQNKLLTAIRQGIIESDIPFCELHAAYIKAMEIPGAPSSVETVQVDPRVAYAQEVQAQRNALQAERAKKEAKLLERCKFLNGLTIRAFKAALKGDQDIQFLRTLLTMEEAGEKRHGIINFLQEKIARHERILSERIIQETAQGKGSYLAPKEKVEYNIEVSEVQQVQISLSPEELIAAALSEGAEDH